jgi:porin
MSACVRGHVAYAADLAIPSVGTSPAPAPVLWPLGDWDGARTRLLNAGIDFQFGTPARSPAMQRAVSGVAWTDRNGSNLSDDAGLGTLQQVHEVFGRGQTLRLTQLWYDQKFIDGAVHCKIGRITFGEDFASFSCDFQNLTFCGAQPSNLVGNYIYNWPVGHQTEVQPCRASAIFSSCV